MYVIDRATAHECPRLPDIEHLACELFATVPVTSGLPPYPTLLEDFVAAQQQGLLWVARSHLDGPVGFALVEYLGDEPHLEELDVLPDHARQGLGTALVRAVGAWAALRSLPLTLTTFRDVPWNRPFYERLGFCVLPDSELPPRLAERMVEETAAGLPRELRVAMRLLPSRT